MEGVWLLLAVILLIVGGDGGKCIFHNPSLILLLLPCKMIDLFFRTVILSLVKCILYPSSHSCPMGIKLLSSFGKRATLVPLDVEEECIGKCP